MSKSTQAAPTKRKASDDEIAGENSPVKVDRVNGGSLLGIVRERHEYDGYDAPARVVVEGQEKTVNVSAEHVSVAHGSNADLVRSLLQDDDGV